MIGIRELSLMDYYNQPTVKKFVNYQPTVKKLEKFRKKGLSTIIPHVILKWSQFNNCSICYRYIH